MEADISAAMKIGITVVLVSALVASVLTLMVMSNSLQASGTTTLQSGIDAISVQQYSAYDNKKVSGTEVKTALSMFQGQDIAIVVQTKAFKAIDNSYADLAINYGAILTANGEASTNSNMPPLITATNPGSYTKTGNYITANAKTAYVIKFTEGTNTAGCALWRNDGAPNYSAYLHNSNGLIDSSYDVIGTTELGNAAYILTSARFSSVLIKDPTGSIIGIFFKQLT